MHSDITTVKRLEIINDLRQGVYDVLVGINLLREGLDIPEVSLVAILDADKQGFLRSTTSLIQTCGRAARNETGTVAMYADVMTDAINKTVTEITNRREYQDAYNKKHNITPKRAERSQNMTVGFEEVMDETASVSRELTTSDIEAKVNEFKKKMEKAAREYEYRKAADYRDQMRAYEKLLLQRFNDGDAT